MKLADRIAILEVVAIPVWIFDIERLTPVWANARGLEIWGATSLEQYRARDFQNPSVAIRTMMRVQQEAIEAGKTLEQVLTFFPLGVPMTLRCHISGIALDDGRVVSLVQAIDAAKGGDPELIRGLQALRHVWAIVSLLDDAGAVLMQNPAGARAFGPAGTSDGWFVDPGAMEAIQREIGEGHMFRGELLARTEDGDRWHAVEARRTLDPVTGAMATLLLQMDVTALRESRQRLEQQEAQIRALSSPILDVGQGALAVPLVGLVDEARGQELAGRLLPEVTARRAGSVILDLTGVDALDEAGAEALMKLVRAVELLGARPILTGIKPILAGMLVSRGVDLGGILTLRSLAAGLVACRRDPSARGGPPRA